MIVVVFSLAAGPTTGNACLGALRANGEDVVHYDPLELADGRLTFRNWDGLPEAELCLQIDDDMPYPAPVTRSPKAYWLIDSHRMREMAFPGPVSTRWQKLQGFDHVLCAQKDMANLLDAPWIPLALDTSVCRPLGIEKKYDWCFVGRMHSLRRKATIAALQACFPDRSFVGEARGEEYNRILNASRVALNVPLANDVNQRFFEVQGTGTPLLTAQTGNGDEELSPDVATYDSIEDCLLKLGLLLHRPPAELAAMGERQRGMVLRDHTYETRVRQMLAALR